MGKFLDGFYKAISSLWLSCVLLILLALLTYLGTLEQVDTGLFEVQRKYFDSIVLVHQQQLFGMRIPIPLPGATLVMWILCVNLIAGGMVRIRKGWATAGIIVTHVGILLLAVAGFVKSYYAYDGHVTLYEGERSNAFQSYHRWEIAAFERLSDGRLREVVAREEDFSGANAARPITFTLADFPFTLEVTRYLPNSSVMPKGPMFEAVLPVIDGYLLQSRPLEAEHEYNVAGAYIAVQDTTGGARREAIVWGSSRAPWVIEVAGRTFGIELRRERYHMPFTVALDDFKKEDHPGMSMAKAFSSDVTVFEGASSRPVKISMNEPLREGGLVLYQSSWGPQNARPGTPIFSVFSVVQNPADQYPLYACIVIAIGLVLHFARKLLRHVRAEAQPS